MCAPPQTVEQFLDRLQSIHDSLPRRLRQCADYAARHQARLAQSSVAEFARGAGVPASTVIRFSQALGFSGYAEMRTLFRSPFLVPRPAYAERLAELRQRAEGQSSALLAEFIDAARLSLERMTDTVQPEAFEAAVQHLAGARMIHTVGVNRCFAISAQIAHDWDRLEVPQVLHGVGGGLPGRGAIRAGDAVLLIALSPLSRDLLDFAAMLHGNGAMLVALCDPGVAMHLRQRGLCLVLSEAEAAGFRPLTSLMTLAIALGAAVASMRAGATQAAQ